MGRTACTEPLPVQGCTLTFTSVDNTPLRASHCQYSVKPDRNYSIQYNSKVTTIAANIRHSSCVILLTVNTAKPRTRSRVHRHKARISLIIQKLMWAQLITYFAPLLFNTTSRIKLTTFRPHCSMWGNNRVSWLNR